MGVGILAAACHEEGDVRVRQLEFDGLQAFQPAQLKSVLATQESGKLPWSKRHYFDRAQFDADLRRIRAYYADRGFEQARITNVDVQLNEAGDAATVRVTIDEGQPVTVEEIRFEGFDSLPENAQNSLRDGPLKTGRPRDHQTVRATRELATRLLHDRGYPLARVTAGERPVGPEGHVRVTFRADPGEAVAFGEVVFDGLDRVGADVVRREVAFDAGQPYRESLILRTQRRLSGLEIFEVVSVTPRLEQIENGLVPIRVTVAEAPPRQLRFGVGYGSEDRARATFNWRHANFFGGARQAEIDAKASSLEQGVRVSLTEPRFRRRALSLNFDGTAWQASRLTYDSQTYGGRVSLSYRTEAGVNGERRPVRYRFKTTYVHEYLRYGIKEEALDDLASRDERIALGLDPVTGRGAGTLAAVEFDVERIHVDDPRAPSRGLITSLHLQQAARWLGGSYRFTEVTAETRFYHPLGRFGFAARGRVGTVSAASPADVPFSKLYFLGGSTSLRGWGRFQVSPLDEQGLPIGGRTLVEMSGELHVPLVDKLSGVFFVDAGDVGGSRWNIQGLRLRADVGPGLRYATPIGIVRADVGFQLNPIAGLVVSGTPNPRPWRVHFSIGQAF